MTQESEARAKTLFRPTSSKPLLPMVVVATMILIPCSTWAQGSAAHTTSTNPSARPTAAAPTAVRVLATRSHMQCPLPGKNTRTLSIDSPGEWDDTIENQNEITALGRQVRWKHERVLIHALESKPYGELRLESPTKVIRLSQGVLYWPVRQWSHDFVRDKDEKRSKPALTRPCVMAIIDRAYWQRIRVVPAQPLSRESRETRR